MTASETSANFTGSVPEFYDRCLGPHLFEDYAQELARRVGRAKPDSVLELAAGTGIASRHIFNALPPQGTLTVTDLHPPMLEVAKAKFFEEEGVSFAPADAMDLPFESNRFDLVACQFGVMFFPDKVAAFADVARVLKPGGQFIFNAWGRMKANPFAEIASGVAEDLFPEDPPRFYEVPFCYPDGMRAQADMTAAGFVDTMVATVDHAKRVEDWGLFAQGLVYGNPLAEEIRDRGSVEPDDAVARIKTELEAHLGATPAMMPLEAIVVSGRVPG